VCSGDRHEQDKDGRVFNEDQSITPIRAADGADHALRLDPDATSPNASAPKQALRRLNAALENESARIAAVLHDEGRPVLSSAHITLADVARDLMPEPRERIQQVRHHLDLAEDSFAASRTSCIRACSTISAGRRRAIPRRQLRRRNAMFVDVDVTLAAPCPPQYKPSSTVWCKRDSRTSPSMHERPGPPSLWARPRPSFSLLDSRRRRRFRGDPDALALRRRLQSGPDADAGPDRSRGRHVGPSSPRRNVAPSSGHRSNGALTWSYRIVLADDHHIVRQGLRALLEKEGLKVIAEAENGRDAVQLAQTHKPDVVVLDLMMPLLNGLEAGREILQNRYAAAARFLLTMHTEEHQIALACGRDPRLPAEDPGGRRSRARHPRSHARRDLSQPDRLAHCRRWLFVRRSTGRQRPAGPRERQVLQLVAEGKTSKEIAVLLGLTVKTAESYRARVMEKLDVHETRGLVRYAIRHGIIDP
jgi:DNA-binding NarL/FixJ family response regulator